MQGGIILKERVNCKGQYLWVGVETFKKHAEDDGPRRAEGLPMRPKVASPSLCPPRLWTQGLLWASVVRNVALY